MKFFFTSFLILLAGLALASAVFSGIGADGALPLVLAAAFLAFVNVTFRRVVRFVTGPLNFFTFGLFMLVVNALILWGAGAVVGGFYVSGFLQALGGALVIGIIGMFAREFTG